MYEKIQNKKTPLGQGLSALLGYSDERSPSRDPGILEQVNINQISARNNQPRKQFSDVDMESLICSVREKGILQPILVRNVSESEFEIIAGERRWRAAKTLGMNTIPVIRLDVSDAEAHEIAIVENVQRHDLNPLEEAEAYNSLIEKYKYTQEKISTAVGKSRSHIANSLRLLNLNSQAKDKLTSGEISPGHARALLVAKDQEDLLKRILAHNLSVRDTEKLAKSQQVKRKVFHDDSLQQQAIELAAKVSEQLTLPVKINLRNDGGQIIISFFSYEQMDQLLEKLRGNN